MIAAVTQPERAAGLDEGVVDRLRERDDLVRRQNQDEMRAIAADPDRARAYIRRVSLLESVQRFGIGRPAAELELEEAR